MTTVTVSEDIAADAAAVWAVLSDFGGIKVGGPIESFEIEGEGVGSVRTIGMGGGKVVERLDEHDAGTMTFAYRIINDDSPLPVANYAARVVVTSTGSGSCHVDWSGSFDARGDEATSVQVIEGIYRGGIAGARKATGG